MTDNNNPHFVTSQNFYGDNEYIEWLREINSRYQTVRSRVALQANYGALEFNWLLGRDIVQKKAEARWELVLSTNSALILEKPILT